MAWVSDGGVPGISMTLKGLKSDTASVSFNQQEEGLLDETDTGTLLDSLKALLEALSDASAFRANYAGFTFVENAFVPQTTGSDMQDVGKFEMITNLGTKATISVPGFNRDKLLAGSSGDPDPGDYAVSTSYGEQMINMGDDDVVAFLSFLYNGETFATGTFTPSAGLDRTGGDLSFVGCERAYLYQKESPTRVWRQG